MSTGSPVVASPRLSPESTTTYTTATTPSSSAVPRHTPHFQAENMILDSSKDFAAQEEAEQTSPVISHAKAAANHMDDHEDLDMKKDGSGSDNDNERPVREQLKKANLGSMNRATSDDRSDEDSVMESHTTAAKTENAVESTKEVLSDRKDSNGNPADRGRPTRKRSFDDVEVDDVHEDERSRDNSGSKVPSGWKTGTHARKRSRDVSAGSGGMNHFSGRRVGSGESYVHVESEEPEDISYSSRFSNAKALPTGVRTPTEVMDEDKEAEPMLSPRKLERKRSRDQFDKDLNNADLGAPTSGSKDDKVPVAEAEPDVPARSVSRTLRDEPEKKRHRDTSQEAASAGQKMSEIKIPSTSGFANTSAVSPFGNLTSPSSSGFGSNTSGTVQTSASAFASSGFGAFASSSTSPFGALSASPPTASPFGTLGGKQASGFAALGSDKAGSSSSGGFVSTPFSMAPSGFASLGGRFGSSSGGGLKNFSSNGNSGLLGRKEKSPKPFGAPEDDEESEDDASDDDANGDEPKEGKKEDPDAEKRFHVQEVETGEEGEITMFSCRAKLYYFNKQEKAWRERGVGTLKLNSTITEEEIEDDRWSGSSEDSEGEERAAQTADTEPRKRKARLLMRADGVLRVVLNVPVFKGMVVGDEKGKLPTGRTVSLTALENGTPVLLQIKMTNPTNAEKLCQLVSKIQEEL